MSRLIDSHMATAAAARISNSARNPALDFTKGALVVFMVLYHWLNYFFGSSGDIYRYLKFLTPSFIFISGFLISNVHLSRYGFSDALLPARLMQRGLKILGLFILLNVTIATAFPHNGRVSLDPSSFVATFVTGNVAREGGVKAAAFGILVPIGYMLVLSAGLVIVARRFKDAFKAACGVLFLLVLILSLIGRESENVELLAIGSLGVVFGYLPIERVNAAAKHLGVLGAAYLVYGIAITIWDVVYPLQVLGVCLTLAALYGLGRRWEERGAAQRLLVTLGKYSLFGYVVQIMILYVLLKVSQSFERGPAESMLYLAAALTLTALSVKIVDRARRKMKGIDWLYKAVFA